MILKLGMKHQGMDLYKVYINHDPGMTLTYFMARLTYVAYPRSKVSVYRTIGPLVLILLQNIDCGYSLEPPRYSTENAQFLQLKKSLYYACACFRNGKSCIVPKVKDKLF